MKRALTPRALLLAGAFSLLAAGHAGAQDQPYLARTWDSSITIPPGGYRSEKPIELNGKIDVTTAPWTLIDNVTFNDLQNGQGWRLNGTIFRRVNLNGQLGVKMEAKDSVFEDCEMKKGGAWFVKMWGSHWNFDNCIFTEKFLTTDLSVQNYAVHANRCTFYGVKLPTIKYTGNPGDYLQKKNFAFVACRFVGCNVPESFLAATVNCVFEDCQFPAKREVWPKDMTSVEVSGMYSGLTDPPASYLDGPLSVRFTEAPSNVDAGSNLPHSQMAGAITLTNYSPPLEYLNFGTHPGNSSEIAPSGGDSSGLPGTGPGGGAVDVHNFDDLVRGLPPNINLIADGLPDIDSIDAANKWLNGRFAGHKAELRTQFDSGAAVDDSSGTYRVASADQSVLCGGTTLAGRAVSLFPAATAGSLSRVARGDALNVRGVIKSVEIQARGANLALVVTLENASAE